MRKQSSQFVTGLVVLQLADIAYNLFMPKAAYTEHLEHLRVPRWLHPTIPIVKTVGTIGLIAGLRNPRLEALTAAALASYYGAATAFHLGAGDRVAQAAPAAVLAGAFMIAATNATEGTGQKTYGKGLKHGR